MAIRHGVPTPSSTGMPANYFVVNPAVNTNNVLDSGAFSDYHALQIDLRRRLSQGLSANVNYQYALEGGSAFDGFLHGRTMVQNGDDRVRHAIKTQWDWTIPVGRGQRYLTDANAWVDGFLGGWSFKGVGRFQALVEDFGNVRLVGMTQDRASEPLHVRGQDGPDLTGRPAACLHAAGRHHPQHPSCVQHEFKHGGRLQRNARRSDGPIYCTGQLTGLYPGGFGRLRAAQS